MINTPTGNNNKFPSKEKLKLKKQIEKLFQTGKAFSFAPIRIIYTFQPKTDDSLLKFGVSVPKKKFKRAVDRNKVKRLIREAWRLQQTSIKELLPQDQQLHCFLVYQHNKIESFEQISKTVTQIITKLAHHLPKSEVSTAPESDIPTSSNA